jgi:predicted transglutaminase-like cysteine proteinase
MALSFIRSRLVGKWHQMPVALCGVAAAAIVVTAFPAAALAQSASDAVPPAADPDCSLRSVDRPIQMAVARMERVEPGAGPLAALKSAAILGGAPSKLDQMRMAQARTDAPTLPAANAASEIAPRTDYAEFCTEAGAAASAPLPSEPPVVIPENAILGTLSVAIKHSPFDRDWAAVNARQGSRKMSRALAATGARGSGDQAAQVEAVNRWVNRKIAYGEDRDVYGRADYWAPASETLRRGVGDCEDFAIAKMELLSALGIGRDKMRLVVARDLVRNADHAVLVVTLANGAVLLDNMTDRLLDARLPNDYRPIMSFSQNAKWVHGYAVQTKAPVRMASAEMVPQPAANRPAANKPAPNGLSDVLTVTFEPEVLALSVALLSAPLVLPTVL